MDKYVRQEPLLPGPEAEPGLAGLLGLQETHQNILIWLRLHDLHAKKIDVISRLLFPSVFALFCAGYWIYYLTIFKAIKKF